jgi:nucleoside-diphosphate-sugar epimerase
LPWQDKKVLVTGGAGQIGANFVDRLVRAGAHVTVADNLWRGKISNLVRDGAPLIDLEADFYKLDLIDYANCRRVVEGRQIVYHLADVVAGINYVFGNQFSLFNTNVTLNSNMLKAAVAAGVEQYIYVGTACSYPARMQNRLHAPPLKEDDVYPAEPESSYGWCKLMGEYECELARQEKLIDVGILRLHNVYGPCCDMSPERSQVIPSLIRKAVKHPAEPFVVWGSGNQRRAFTFVEDVVDALMAVVDAGMNQGAIQIGPDHSESVRSIAEKIVDISGKDIQIEFDTSRPEGDKDRVADWSKAKRILGWAPGTDIDTGLAKTYTWCARRLAEDASI